MDTSIIDGWEVGHGHGHGHGHAGPGHLRGSIWGRCQEEIEGRRAL